VIYPRLPTVTNGYERILECPGFAAVCTLTALIEAAEREIWKFEFNRPQEKPPMRDVPHVSFSSRLDIPTTELRRRLERETGLGTSRLITEALRVLAEKLNSKGSEAQA
jgi:hypothetical protein